MIITYVVLLSIQRTQKMNAWFYNILWQGEVTCTLQNISLKYMHCLVEYINEKHYIFIYVLNIFHHFHNSSKMSVMT